MVIDDQQQAEGVQLASHNWQHFNPSSRTCGFVQTTAEWQL